MTKSLTVEEIAALTGAIIVGNKDLIITGVSDLESAAEEHLSFLANPRYLSAMQKSKAGAIFIDNKSACAAGKTYLITENPSLSFQKIIEVFHQDKLIKSYFSGISPLASIAEGVIIGKNVTIAPFVVIEQGVVIGDNTYIGAHTSIGPHTTIGKSCYLFPHVTVREHCTLHNKVILQSGVIIGSCGFGYSTDHLGVHTKLEQVGGVIIEDEVEIGANTTIDRGRFNDTLIKRGTKIDNLVQIAHNVELGRNNLIVAQCGLAGSSKTGTSVIIGGQGALVGHISIADGTIIAARGAASKSVTTPGGIYSGAPMQPIDKHNKQAVYLRKIESYVKRIEALEEKCDTLLQREASSPSPL